MVVHFPWALPSGSPTIVLAAVQLSEIYLNMASTAYQINKTNWYAVLLLGL